MNSKKREIVFLTWFMVMFALSFFLGYISLILGEDVIGIGIPGQIENKLIMVASVIAMVFIFGKIVER